MQDFSYHTHTAFSDGESSIEKMLNRAVELGWSEIGISDHLIIHENIRNTYSWADFESHYGKSYFDSFLQAYEYTSRNIEYISKISKQYPIKVKIGFEVDYFTYDGWKEQMRSLLSKLDLDYLVTGNHFLQDNNGLEIIKPLHLNRYSEDEVLRKELISKHFLTIAKAINSKLFDFVAHFDLLRLMDLCGESGFEEERRAILIALQETNTAFEISTKGLRIPQLKDFYPASWSLKEAQKLNIPVVISDDAHRDTELGCGFDKAEQYLKELNYTNRWKLK